MKTWSIFRNSKEVNSSFRYQKEVGSWLLFVIHHYECGGEIKDDNLTTFMQEARDLGYYTGEIENDSSQS